MGEASGGIGSSQRRLHSPEEEASLGSDSLHLSIFFSSTFGLRVFVFNLIPMGAGAGVVVTFVVGGGNMLREEATGTRCGVKVRNHLNCEGI